MTTTTEAAEQAAVLGKIERLLRMTTENGCSENEALVAATKIQEILAAHNLTLAALEQAEPAAAAAEPREMTDGGGAGHKWKRRLMACLADNNFCLHFIINTGHYRKFGGHQLLGRKVNVVVTIQTYNYLLQAMQRLNPYHPRREQVSHTKWCDGCADRLIERLNQRRIEQELESRRAAQAQGNGTGTELMVLSDVYGSEEDLNQDALNGREPGTTARQRRERAAQWAAYEAQDKARREALRQREQELIAGGMSEHSAYYVARGLAIPPPPKAKTAKQQAKEEAREERERERDEARRKREWERDEERRNHPAYRDGRASGNSIGLDEQIDTGAERKRLR